MTCVFLFFVFFPHRNEKTEENYFGSTGPTHGWKGSRVGGRLSSPSWPLGSLQAKCTCGATDCQLPGGHQAWLQTVSTGRGEQRHQTQGAYLHAKRGEKTAFSYRVALFPHSTAERTCHTCTAGSMAMVPLSLVGHRQCAVPLPVSRMHPTLAPTENSESLNPAQLQVDPRNTTAAGEETIGAPRRVCSANTGG